MKSIERRILPMNISRVNPSPATKRITGHALQRIRRRILLRDGYQCQQCKREGRLTIAEEVDHIVPLFMGGPESPENRQSLCVACHQSKSEKEEKDRTG